MSIQNIIKKVKSSNDLLYLALLGIYSKASQDCSKMNSRTVILPELVYLLDEQSLINLVTYYGGESITIPKASHIKDQLYGILAYYYSETLKINDWQAIIAKMELPYSPALETKLRALKAETEKSLKDIRLLPRIPNSDNI